MKSDHLHKIKCPCRGFAFVEDKIISNPIGITGHRMGGKWISGVAIGVYTFWNGCDYLLFIDEKGEKYTLEYEAQFTQNRTDSPEKWAKIPHINTFVEIVRKYGRLPRIYDCQISRYAL